MVQTTQNGKYQMVMWILPKTENFSNGDASAWRNGTVNDYFNWTQITKIFKVMPIHTL